MIRAKPTPNPSVTVALCFLVAVLEGFDIQAMGVAAPRLAPEFGFNPSQMGWLFSISNIGLVIGASFGGWLADRVGRKPIFIAAVLAFGVFTFATAHAGSFESLFAVRLLVGIGFGAALPNLVAVASEVSAPERRSFTTAVVFCGMPLGGGTSALITQVMPAAAADWRTLFLIGGSLPIVLVPLLYFFLRETLRKDDAVIEEKRSVGMALFGEGRAVPTLLLWLTFLPTLLILYLILNWLPTLVAANGLDKTIAPQASLAFNFASVVGALFFGSVVDRFGPRWSLGLAYAALIGALLALSQSHTLPSVLTWSAAAGFCLLGANYALYGVTASYYPQSVRGTGSGSSVAIGRVGSVFGPLLAGWLLGRGLSASSVVGILAPIAALAGVAVFALSFFPAKHGTSKARL
ncbi:MAG TPA: 3-(3-hydroxy-phenyl)propionate transporter MhpT [Steroidobacteraceae bacterium]|nr:3-(3-hydroxy-phenyl)propionate transporter MhpT [Steroidobacteraceae bacterium]